MSGLKARKSIYAARSDGWVLAEGLGAMGVGRMWVERDTTKPEFADLPYVPGIRGSFDNLMPEELER